jgi:hypothetical protein
MQTDLSFLVQDTIDINRFREVIDTLAQSIDIEASPDNGLTKRPLIPLRGSMHEIIRRSDLVFTTTEPNLLPGGKIPLNTPKRFRSLARSLGIHHE